MTSFSATLGASSSAQLELVRVHNRASEATAALLLAEYVTLHDLGRHSEITVLLTNLEGTASSGCFSLLLLLLLLLLRLRLHVLLGECCESLSLLHVDARVHWRGHLQK